MILKVITVLTLSTFLFAANPIFADSKPTINEFVAHPSTGNKEWVEFYNPDSVDLSSYFLDDDSDFGNDSGSSAKKSLSAINKSDQTHPYLEFDSFLNNGGDSVVLFSPDGSLIDQYSYTEDPGIDTSVGRSPDGNSQLVKLAIASKGSANSQAQADPTPLPEPTSSKTSSTPKTTALASTTTSSKTTSPTPTKSTTNPPQVPGAVIKSSPSVLGTKEENASPSAQPQSPEPTQSPNQKTEEKPKDMKVAYYMSGLGTILIAGSVVFYFLTHRKPKPEESDEESSNNK